MCFVYATKTIIDLVVLTGIEDSLKSEWSIQS